MRDTLKGRIILITKRAITGRGKIKILAREAANFKEHVRSNCFFYKFLFKKLNQSYLRQGLYSVAF